MPLADELPGGIPVRTDARIPDGVALVGDADSLTELLANCRTPITYERLRITMAIMNAGRPEPRVQVVRV